MCLENFGKQKIAEKDIVCYKVLSTGFIPKIKGAKSGETYTLMFNTGVEIEGKLMRGKPLRFKVTIPFDGNNFFRTTYRFVGGESSRLIGIKDKNGKSLEVNLKPVFETFFRATPIEIGETYTSEIKVNNYTIHKALHSFCYKKDARVYGNFKVAKCIIPKGSIYYRGIFGSVPSYASNQLKYVEIIGDYNKKIPDSVSNYWIH